MGRFEVIKTAMHVQMRKDLGIGGEDATENLFRRCWRKSSKFNKIEEQ
jgi:hypothetical protein